MILTTRVNAYRKGILVDLFIDCFFFSLLYFIEYKILKPEAYSLVHKYWYSRNDLTLTNIILLLSRNPGDRRGLRGRGILGRWGPNHAADPIVTRCDCSMAEWFMFPCPSYKYCTYTFDKHSIRVLLVCMSVCVHTHTRTHVCVCTVCVSECVLIKLVCTGQWIPESCNRMQRNAHAHAQAHTSTQITIVSVITKLL